MNMIGHDHKGMQSVVPKLLACVQTAEHDLCDSVVFQEHWPGASRVEVAIHPNEGPAAGHFPRRRIQAMGQATVQMPSNEQRLVLWIVMRQTAAMKRHRSDSAAPYLILSRFKAKLQAAAASC